MTSDIAIVGAGITGLSDADDSIRARRDGSQHRRLIAAEHAGSFLSDALDRRRRDNRGTDPAGRDPRVLDCRLAETCRTHEAWFRG